MAKSSGEDPQATLKDTEKEKQDSKEEPKGKTGEKTFSEKEFQAEVDRRVTSALRKREAELEDEREQAVEAERQRFEEEKLKEQGDWQKLHEQTQAELDALKAEKARAEFERKTREALKEAELPELSDVVLKKLDTVKGVVAAAKEIKDIISKRVESDIVARLNTGTAPAGTPATSAKTRLADFHSEEEKSEFIDHYGLDAWQAIVDRG